MDAVEKLCGSGLTKLAGTASCGMIRSSDGMPAPQEVEVLLGAVDPDAASRSATAASLSAAELGVTPLGAGGVGEAADPEDARFATVAVASTWGGAAAAGGGSDCNSAR